MGAGDLWWELNRLKDFKGQEGLYQVHADLCQEKHHWLAMRDVYMDQFFEDPKNMVHSCRMQVSKKYYDIFNIISLNKSAKTNYILIYGGR